MRMNKLLFFLASLVLATNFSVAQQWNGSSNANGNIYRNGNVGLGTSSPGARLDVVGQIQSDYLRVNRQNNTIEGGEIRLDGASSSINNWFLDNYSGHFRLHHSGKEYLRLESSGRLVIPRSIRWGTKGALLNTDQGASIELRGDGVPYFDFSNDGSTDYDMRLILINNDLLAIHGGNLAVDGKIKTKEISVQTNVWADYVFNKNYELPSIEEVERHIETQGHLKGIPKTEKVLRDGFDLGEMNIKLLQKIEELTLYVIDQNHKNKQLSTEVEKLKEEIKRLK